MDVIGGATIEAVLQMSAEQLAGPRQQGKKSDRDVVYHGSQAGRVTLRERQLKVSKPRLRKRRPQAGEPGEVEIPADAAMHDDARLADRMLPILMRGASTRNHTEVLPEMAETVGVSKSQVSPEFGLIVGPDGSFFSAQRGTPTLVGRECVLQIAENAPDVRWL